MEARFGEIIPIGNKCIRTLSAGILAFKYRPSGHEHAKLTTLGGWISLGARIWAMSS